MTTLAINTTTPMGTHSRTELTAQRHSISLTSRVDAVTATIAKATTSAMINAR
jgi:hypothetical protein